MTQSDPQVLKGTLDLIILRSLQEGPRHGFGITRWLHATTDQTLALDDGALYPALRRLMHRGWIDAQWGVSENNRRARYYRLTRKGRRQLDREIAKWQRLSHQVRQILDGS